MLKNQPSRFGYLFNYCAHNGCFNRRFTWADAVDQWRNGNGGTVTGVVASELNLRGATYTKNEDGSYQIHTNIRLETGVIYGTVTADLNVNGTLSIRPDYYNFDFKNPANANSWSEAWRLIKRDFFTGAGAVVNGYGGKPYNIEFTGTIPAPPGLPR